MPQGAAPRRERPLLNQAAASVWRLLRSGAGEPGWNLALDEALLLSSDPAPVLRLYAWDPPGLSLGHFQPVEPFVPIAREAGLRIVRRPTGGGAIHHADELTFCFVATPGRDGYPADVVEAYEVVHASLRAGLATLGVHVDFRGGDVPMSVKPGAATLCFEDTTRLDLVDGDGRKLVGSAQRRRGGRVLHHGSIPLTAPALSPSAAGVCELAGRSVSWQELADVLVAAWSETLCLGGFHEDQPSESERGHATTRAAELELNADS